MKKLLLLVIALLVTKTYCQEKLEYVDLGIIQEKYNEFSSKNQLSKIDSLLSIVSENDSLYNNYLVTKSHNLLKQEKYKEAIEAVNEGLQSNVLDNRLSFYLNKSTIYIRQGDFENALLTLDEAIDEFPRNADLFFNRGVTYYEMEKYEDAIEALVSSCNFNPLKANVHLKLGNICLKQNLTSMALMCFNTYLLLNPDGEDSFEILKGVNSVLAAGVNNEKIEGLQISKNELDFEELDLILNSKMTLSNDYEVDNEISIAYTKQNHALFQKIVEIQPKNDSWENKYVEFYSWMQENGYFNEFIYTTTYSIENEEYKKVIEKKLNEIKAFIPIYKQKWLQITQNFKLDFDGSYQEVSAFIEDDKLLGIGTIKNDTITGYWELYDSYGKISSKGYFNELGNRTGEWFSYFKNGKVVETAFYNNGKLDGENKGYFKNGQLKFDVKYINGELNGPYSLYYETGALNESKFFVNDKIDQTYTSYYAIGKPVVEYIIDYKNGLLDGEIKQFFANGKPQYIAFTKDNKLNGEIKGFYKNGENFRISTYKNDLFEGSYKSFYANGNLKEIGQGSNDLREGNWKEYFANGQLKTEYNYVEGNLDGQYLDYNINGKLMTDFTYKNGNLIAYKCFDKNGNILSEGHKKGGEFLYEGYNLDGIKTVEGLYNVKGGKDGNWNYYSENGVLNNTGKYTDNLAQGENKYYYENGNLMSVSNYVDEVLTGYYVNYYKDGQITSQGYFKDDEKDKTWKTYYHDGTLSDINYFHKGEKNGMQENFAVDGKIYSKQYYEFGKLLTELFYDIHGNILDSISFENLKMDTVITTQFANKKIKSKSTYKYGVKNGLYTEYNFFGKKVLEGQFLNNMLHGKWTWFYDNGNVKLEINYNQDELDGNVKKYYENGKLKETITYILDERFGVNNDYAEDGKTITGTADYLSDELHGRKVFYSDEGELQLIRFYEFGKLVGYSYLNAENQEIPMIPIEKETAKIVSYYNNGNIAREMELKNGEVVNWYKVYFYTGELQEEQFNVFGELQGELKIYYKNGNLKESIAYANDDRNGKSTKYSEEGNIIEEVNYLNNAKNGAAKYYDENGKLIRVESYFNDIVYEVQ